MRSMLFATLVWVLAAPALDSAPGAPVNLTSSVSGSTVTLTWSAPAGGGTPTAYIIEAGSSLGLANLASINTGSAATSFSTTGVAAGTYFVRVKAMNAAGTSSASNEATLSVSGSVCTAPGAPGGLTLVTNSGGTVSVSWTAATGSPATYIIEAGSAPGSSDLANSDLGSVATSFTLSSVANGGYYIRVRARNACGTSGPSNEIVVTVGPTTPLGVGRWNTPCAIQGQLAIVGLYLVCDGGKWRSATGVCWKAMRSMPRLNCTVVPSPARMAPAPIVNCRCLRIGCNRARESPPSAGGATPPAIFRRCRSGSKAGNRHPIN